MLLMEHLNGFRCEFCLILRHNRPPKTTFREDHINNKGIIDIFNHLKAEQESISLTCGQEKQDTKPDTKTFSLYFAFFLSLFICIVLFPVFFYRVDGLKNQI